MKRIVCEINVKNKQHSINEDFILLLVISVSSLVFLRDRSLISISSTQMKSEYDDIATEIEETNSMK